MPQDLRKLKISVPLVGQVASLAPHSIMAGATAEAPTNDDPAYREALQVFLQFKSNVQEKGWGSNGFLNLSDSHSFFLQNFSFQDRRTWKLQDYLHLSLSFFRSSVGDSRILNVVATSRKQEASVSKRD